LRVVQRSATAGLRVSRLALGIVVLAVGMIFFALEFSDVILADAGAGLNR
jgi:hypothetical protein